MYELAAGQLVFVNDAYRAVLHGESEEANTALPALLSRLHPDDRSRLAEYWAQWGRGELRDEFEFRLRHAEAPDQWFCLTPYCEQDAEGAVWLVGSLRDISVSKRYQANADLFNSRKKRHPRNPVARPERVLHPGAANRGFVTGRSAGSS